MTITIKDLPETVPEAEPDYTLATYNVSPKWAIFLSEDSESIWEVWDPVFNWLLQGKDAEDSVRKVQGLVAQGRYGTIGLHNYFRQLVVAHGINIGLIEAKVNQLNEAVKTV